MWLSHSDFDLKTNWTISVFYGFQGVHNSLNILSYSHLPGQELPWNFNSYIFNEQRVLDWNYVAWNGREKGLFMHTSQWTGGLHVSVGWMISKF